MPRSVLYLLRSVWFVVRTAIVAAAVLLVSYWAFTYAFNVANIYIIMQEGMLTRAEVVMQDEDRAELTKYFADSFIDKDELLSQNAYSGYVIRSFNHDIEFESVNTSMFSSKGTAVIYERVSSIDGEKPDSAEEEGEEEKSQPPAWQNTKYKASLRKTNGIWKIELLEVEEILPTPTPKPTPTPTPGGESTPKPAVIIETPAA
ncbi:MAG: hypothetical protein ACOYJD_07160 [Christensenellales bacterium]|jgi:hypothetical protein